MPCARHRRWLVYNGEIYDIGPLRAALAADGYPFRTASDGEVILAAYDAWGIGCVDRFGGEYAFAIWDESAQTLFAARDPAGVKPLFWSADATRFAFASEAKALLVLPGARRALSADYLCGPLLGAYPEAVSAFEGIHALPPGGRLWLAAGAEPKVVPRSWRAPVVDPTLSLADARALVKQEVTAAVERRLVGEVPVHLFLSGGIDSTVLAAVLARHKPGFSAFHVCFDDAALDESGRAAQVAAAVGAAFVPLRLSADALAADLEATVWHTELAVANPNAMARRALARLARDAGARVVLTGEGADERFGGYPYFKLEALWRRWATADAGEAAACAALWETFQGREQASKGLGWYPGRGWRRGPHRLGFPSFHAQRVRAARTAPRWLFAGALGGAETLSPEERFYQDLDLSSLQGAHPFHISRHIADRQLAGYLLPILGDRVEMAHGVEGRTPFLDERLQAAIDRIPPELQLDLPQLQEKRLLREAFADAVPAVAGPMHKHPFLAPGWGEVAQTRTGRALFDAYLSPSALREAGVFRPSVLGALRCTWHRLPRAANARRVLDLLLGSALGVQVLHAQFIARLPDSNADFPLQLRQLR